MGEHSFLREVPFLQRLLPISFPCLGVQRLSAAARPSLGSLLAPEAPGPGVLEARAPSGKPATLNLVQTWRPVRGVWGDLGGAGSPEQPITLSVVPPCCGGPGIIGRSSGQLRLLIRTQRPFLKGPHGRDGREILGNFLSWGAFAPPPRPP